MRIPFTVEQFFDLFGTYNTAIWPIQIFAYALGIIAIVMALRESKASLRIIPGVLALFWLWMGIVYHMIHFSVINPVARIFGIAFVLQGLLFLLMGTIFPKLSLRFILKPIPIIGACFMLYAIIIYPILGISFGHYYPNAPMFGVAPCPTTIFTFGLLLWATKPVPAYLLIIPFLWSIVGMSAAVNLRVPQDYGLVVAGVLGTILILIQNRKAKMMAQESSVNHK